MSCNACFIYILSPGLTTLYLYSNKHYLCSIVYSLSKHSLTLLGKQRWIQYLLVLKELTVEYSQLRWSITPVAMKNTFSFIQLENLQWHHTNYKYHSFLYAVPKSSIIHATNRTFSHTENLNFGGLEGLIILFFKYLKILLPVSGDPDRNSMAFEMQSFFKIQFYAL